jgi:hypothetical protein
MDNRSAQPKVKLGNDELEQAKDKGTIAEKQESCGNCH